MGSETESRTQGLTDVVQRSRVYPRYAFVISLAANLQRLQRRRVLPCKLTVLQPWQSRILFLPVPCLEKLSRAG